MRIRHLLTCIAISVVLMAATLVSACAQTQASKPCADYDNPAQPQLATCNSSWGSSKLFTNAQITIYAPETSATPQCHTINSMSSTHDYFVPWRTAAEWTAFLAAANNYTTLATAQAQAKQTVTVPFVVNHGCCIPIKVTKLSCTLNDGTTVSVPLGTSVSLGNRALGTPLDNSVPPKPTYTPVLSAPVSDDGNPMPFADYGISEWGAQGDVSGAVVATQDSKGNPINYEVVYTCDSDPATNSNINNPKALLSGYGGWIKMYSSGSCTPTNGACASGTATFPNDTPPQNLNSANLCAPGSVYQVGSFATTPTGWTWTCDGTGGGGCGVNGDEACTNAQCSASLSSKISGQCGTLTNAPYSQSDMTTDYAACVANPSACPLCAGGTPSGTPFSYNNQSSVWQWYCMGSNGGTNAFCSVANSSLVGTCGSANGITTSQPNALNAQSTTLCSDSTETVTNFTYTPRSDGTGYWSWTCSTPLGSANCSTQYTPTAGFFQGQCGSANSGHYQPPNAPPTAGLCSVGTAINLQNIGYWVWTCVGSSATDPNAVTNCAAYATDPTAASANPGQCSSTAGLCSYGTGSDLACDASNNCSWQCTGDVGTSAVACAGTANAVLPTADGACGPANGQATYVAPNQNLCSTGSASVVSGTGPWTWQCQGTGASSVNQSCQASICSVCSGTYVRGNSTTRSGSNGSCTMSGTAAWTETDQLSTVASGPSTLSWIDQAGNFSYGINSTSATNLRPSAGQPTFCASCYLSLSSVSNVTVNVAAATNACPTGAGSSLTPTSIAVSH